MSKESDELRQVFARLYPLTPLYQLPSAACHIPEFLRDRIAHEVKLQTNCFSNNIVRILADVVPPKHHVEDMLLHAAGLAKMALSQWNKDPPLNERCILLHPQSGRNGFGMAITHIVCEFDTVRDKLSHYPRNECLWMPIPGYSGDQVF